MTLQQTNQSTLKPVVIQPKDFASTAAAEAEAFAVKAAQDALTQNVAKPAELQKKAVADLTPEIEQPASATQVATPVVQAALSAPEQYAANAQALGVAVFLNPEISDAVHYEDTDTYAAKMNAKIAEIDRDMRSLDPRRQILSTKFEQLQDRMQQLKFEVKAALLSNSTASPARRELIKLEYQIDQIQDNFRLLMDAHHECRAHATRTGHQKLTPLEEELAAFEKDAREKDPATLAADWWKRIDEKYCQSAKLIGGLISGVSAIPVANPGGVTSVVGAAVTGAGRIGHAICEPREKANRAEADMRVQQKTQAELGRLLSQGSTKSPTPTMALRTDVDAQYLQRTVDDVNHHCDLSSLQSDDRSALIASAKSELADIQQEVQKKTTGEISAADAHQLQMRLSALRFTIKLIKNAQPTPSAQEMRELRKIRDEAFHLTHTLHTAIHEQHASKIEKLHKDIRETSESQAELEKARERLEESHPHVHSAKKYEKVAKAADGVHNTAETVAGVLESCGEERIEAIGKIILFASKGLHSACQAGEQLAEKVAASKEKAAEEAIDETLESESQKMEASRHSRSHVPSTPSSKGSVSSATDTADSHDLQVDRNEVDNHIQYEVTEEHIQGALDVLADMIAGFNQEEGISHKDAEASGIRNDLISLNKQLKELELANPEASRSEKRRFLALHNRIHHLKLKFETLQHKHHIHDHELAQQNKQKEADYQLTLRNARAAQMAANKHHQRAENYGTGKQVFTHGVTVGGALVGAGAIPSPASAVLLPLGATVAGVSGLSRMVCHNRQVANEKIADREVEGTIDDARREDFEHQVKRNNMMPTPAPTKETSMYEQTGSELFHYQPLPDFPSHSSPSSTP